MADSGKNLDPQSGEISPAEREAFKKRAEALGERIGGARSRGTPLSKADATQRGNAIGQAMKIAVELVAGVGVGGGIGWFLDRQLGTKPWLFIVFLMIGFAAGMMNVVRTARRMQAGAEHMQRSARAVKDDEDDR